MTAVASAGARAAERQRARLHRDTGRICAKQEALPPVRLRVGGTGLGLAIAKGIPALGGRIVLDRRSAGAAVQCAPAPAAFSRRRRSAGVTAAPDGSAASAESTRSLRGRRSWSASLGEQPTSSPRSSAGAALGLDHRLEPLRRPIALFGALAPRQRRREIGGLFAQAVAGLPELVHRSRSYRPHRMDSRSSNTTCRPS
jgi:hypothetical protein